MGTLQDELRKIGPLGSLQSDERHICETVARPKKRRLKPSDVKRQQDREWYFQLKKSLADAKPNSQTLECESTIAVASRSRFAGHERP